MKHFKNIFFIIGIFLTGLCTLEIIYRGMEFAIFGLKDNKSKNAHSSKFTYPPQEFAAYTMRDNIKSFQSETMSTDENGFRSPPLTIEKKTDVFRVAILGASTAVSFGNPGYKNTFAGQLQQQLQSRIENKVEILCAAVSAFNSTQEVIQFHLKVMQYKPDYLIALSGRNDIYFSTLKDWQQDKSSEITAQLKFIKDYREYALSPFGFLHLNSHILRDVLNMATRFYPSIADTLNIPDFGINYHDYVAIDQGTEPSTIWANNMLNLKYLAQGIDGNFLAILQPSLLYTSKVLTYKEKLLKKSIDLRRIFPRNFSSVATNQYKRFEEELKNLESKDKLSALYPKSFFTNVEEQIFIDDAHINATGNRHLAKHVIDFILNDKNQHPSVLKLKSDHSAQY